MPAARASGGSDEDGAWCQRDVTALLGRSGTRIGDLPRLTGVSREANAMCTGWLERHGCLSAEPDATARRGRVVRLTAKGEKARQ